jgi:hypothetical protein
MKEIPVVERRYKPSPRYRLGCLVIRLVGKLANVDIDFEPMALPGDRVTGLVNCPHCSATNLVTVSLFNEAERHCQNPDCCKLFSVMNDGIKIWILLREGEHDRMDQH